MGISTRTAATAAGVALAMAAAAGTGYAYWSSHSTGSGTASTASPTDASVTAVTPSGDLFPGGKGAAQFTITNPNSSAYTYTQVTTATVTSSSPLNCPSSNVTVVPQLAYSLPSGITVAARTTSSTQSLPNFLQMASAAPNGCQGVTFTVALTLTGTTN